MHFIANIGRTRHMKSLKAKFQRVKGPVGFFRVSGKN